MDVNGDGRKEQVEESWIPKTPFKPISSNPQIIYTDKQGYPVDPEQLDRSRSTGYSSNYYPGTTFETWSACPDSNWEIALQAKGGTSEEPWPDVFGGTKMNFMSLLALQDQASAASMYRNGLESGGLWCDNFRQNATNGIAASHGPAPDLNLPPVGTAESISHRATIQMAPVTPEKTPRPDITFALDQGSQNTAAEVNSRPETSTELQEVGKNSSGAVSSVVNENGNDVGGLETPQQKPKRRKHRPKVITEGKPRVRKPATPKPVTPAENQTGKRKYVRKKPLEKTPATTTPTEPKDGSTPPTECKGISTPQAECEGSSAGKRKYVRKKLINEEATPVEEPTGEPTLAQTSKPANYSCRRSLNFDADVDTECRPNSDGGFQSLPEDVSEWCKSKLTVNIGRGIEVMVEPTCDLSRSIDQMRQKYDSLPEQRMPNAPLAAMNSSPEKRAPDEPLAAMNSLPERRAPEELLAAMNSLPEVTAPTVPFSAMNSLPERAPNAPLAAMNSLPEKRALEELFAPLSQAQKRKRNGREVRGNQVTAHYAHLQPRGINASNWLNRTEWEKCNFGKQQDSCSSNITGICYNSVSTYEAVKRQNSTASSISCVTYLTSSKETIKLETIGVHRSNMQPSSSILTQVEGPTRKRSRTPTRLRDVDSLTKIVRGRMSYNVHQVADLDISCNEALAAAIDKQLTTKKRSKDRVSLVNYQPSSSNVLSHGKIMLNNRNQYSPMLLGTSPADIWMSPIIQQLQQLDINRETSAIAYSEHNALVPYSYSTTNEQNALVLYGRDGTVVPFQPIRRRKPRPKVDLDEETGKVWRLLLENINSEGIDGTDEEKAKWWKDEREVFSGRANSFIARMHLVQGDRRFTPWKGSVVDSVVGVFLTQNVSDHLSSSAFMSMAANFPLKSTTHEAMRDSTSENPIVCIPDLEDAINDVSNPSTVNQSPMILHVSEPDEEREADYSNESSMSSTGIIHSTNGVEGFDDSVEKRSTTDVSKTISSCHLEGNRSIANDAVSSQNSVVSSQNSTDSPFAQTSDRTEFFSDNSAEADQIDRFEHNCLNSTNTFTELLMKAGRNELHEVPSHNNGTFLSTHNPFLFGKIQNVESEKKCSADSSKSSLERSSTSESANQIKDGNIVNNPTHEASKYTAADDLLRSNIQDMQLAMHPEVGVAKDLSIVEKSEIQAENELQQNVISPNLTGKDQDIVESSRAFSILEKDSQKTPESHLTVDGFQETKELAAKRKAKGRRVGGEIRDDVDWDALKKEAESNGRKRERTPDTMDSVDWEAVRCADVSKIADTIKERGMNNVLAGRIKDFLNRLVREHGSIDLEWLRDVPPDKAKEYLLTIRGLGLKSVECIRLLTLHHLAFPVDTNVARIAVRLGWVPLQPLPESLQLHLLELYPIQESIQKYLWPRLCKLDQKTLYELHYQLITFGKVFCTKSKPNCNACPMRGECRHFASAFASARLSLPGPEEKGIVSAVENRKNEPNPAVMVDQLRLSLPQMIEKSEENQHSELKQLSEVRGEVKKCEPIVEEPSSPEPACNQVAEIDIEDTFQEDPDEIPTIKLNIEEFTQNLQTYMQNNMELQEGEMSKALVALTEEAASIPMPKLKNVSRLRTEHHVYELPDSHPLLQGLDRREPDDPCSYLLAIWTPGETANSIQPPESTCNMQEQGKFCDETTCFSCNSIREANSQIVRATLLIPCRTAMRGSFPLNGTYFQVNEVFADHDSSLNPIDVPRSWIWNLPRRTVYFGTSIPTIFKGLTTEGIQHCFWRGYVCVRGFDQKTRAPRPLLARLHFPVSKLKQTKRYNQDE